MQTMRTTQIERALVILGMTQADLANCLTAMRVDGKSTTKATVSRWVRGHSPPPPELLLFLRQRLIEHAKKHPPLLDGLKIITVGGGKGGSGSTSICVFLAAAAQMRGYRVRLGATPDHLDGLRFCSREFLSPFGAVKSVDLSHLSRLQQEVSASTDLLIVDVGNKTMLTEQALKNVELHRIDLAVVPFNPAGALDWNPAQMVAKSFLGYGIERFMLQPFVDRLSLGLLLKHRRCVVNTRKFGQFLSPYPIFKRAYVESPRALFHGRDSSFQDDDLQIEYTDVLHEILRRLGADECAVDMQWRDLEQLSFDDLINLLSAK